MNKSTLSIMSHNTVNNTRLIRSRHQRHRVHLKLQASTFELGALERFKWDPRQTHAGPRAGASGKLPPLCLFFSLGAQQRRYLLHFVVFFLILLQQNEEGDGSIAFLLFSCNVAKKALAAMLPSPSALRCLFLFLLQQSEEGNGNSTAITFFFFLQCNKEGNSSNAAITFFAPLPSFCLLQ